MLLAGLVLAAQVERMAHDFLGHGPHAGLSIAVVRRGHVLLARGYGHANAELHVAATAATVYHVDSITKHLTAGAVLRLVQQRKLSLDDRLTQYVPNLPSAWSAVTIRQLLNHTSGIVSFTSLPNWGPQERLDVSHDDVLALIRDLPLEFAPGTSWRYDNSGFYLLGMVVEKVTGKNYADAMRELVFAPAGMQSTTYCGYRPLVPNRAAGYEAVAGKLVNAEPMSWAAPFAGGAICSTVQDLARYERALGNGTLIESNLLREMRMTTHLPDAEIDYGLGTRLGRLGTHRMVGHTGSGGGFRGVMEHYPDDGLTIVVLSNTGGEGPSVVALASDIARLLLAIPRTAEPDLAIPEAKLNQYTGHFVSDEGAVRTSTADGKLVFRPDGAPSTMPLHFRGNGMFDVTPDIAVRFTVIGGMVTWAQSYVGGLFADASRRSE